MDCECIILYVKMNFADVIKIANQLGFKQEGYLVFFKNKGPYIIILPIRKRKVNN